MGLLYPCQDNPQAHQWMWRTPCPTQGKKFHFSASDGSAFTHRAENETCLRDMCLTIDVDGWRKIWPLRLEAWGLEGATILPQWSMQEWTPKAWKRTLLSVDPHFTSRLPRSVTLSFLASLFLCCHVIVLLFISVCRYSHCTLALSIIACRSKFYHSNSHSTTVYCFVRPPFFFFNSIFVRLEVQNPGSTSV